MELRLRPAQRSGTVPQTRIHEVPGDCEKDRREGDENRYGEARWKTHQPGGLVLHRETHPVPSDLPDVAELQLLFAQYNLLHFDGQLPAYRIAYNARFSNVAGRITYKPPLIELSPKHLRGKIEDLRQTLLHEMIHAWLHARGENSGHTPAFKRKMRELGLRSIYHDLGTAAPLNPSSRRYILRCEKCGAEALRKRKPPANAVCVRCRRSFAVFEIVEMRPVEPARAAMRKPPFSWSIFGRS